jgi:hypothetical protein
VPVCPTDDRGVMETTMRPVIADYLQAPAYAAQQRRLGRGPALEAMWKAWEAGDRDGARSAVPSALLDELTVWGDLSTCRAHLAEIERATGGRAIATFFSPAGAPFRDTAF